MSLRTTALVAGVIGALLLAVGLIADSQRPPTDVSATARIETPIVVYEPEMLAFVGESRMGFTSDGTLEAVSARPADAAAWLASRDATRVTGLPDWETLAVTTDPLEVAEDPEAQASPGPTASPDASPSPTASPEASPTSSPAASPTVSPTAAPEDGEAEEDQATASNLLTETSEDLWRQRWHGDGRLAIQGSAVPAGEILVVVSTDGSAITETDLSLTREVDDGWITPLIWWGAFLLTAGVIAFILRLVDLRPVQARGEEWVAKRQRTGEGENNPKPGSRRFRRATGDVLPEPRLDEEAIAAEAAARASAATPASAASAPSVRTEGEPPTPQTPDGEEPR